MYALTSYEYKYMFLSTAKFNSIALWNVPNSRPLKEKKKKREKVNNTYPAISRENI